MGWAFVSLLLVFVAGLVAVGPAGAQATPGAERIVLGDEESVEVSYEGGKPVEVLANMDTGAGYASIDEELARDMGMDVDDPPDTVTIESSLGEEERPLFPVELKMAGRDLNEGGGGALR